MNEDRAVDSVSGRPSFSLYNLPLEIRYMIYHATWEPRAVPIYECDSEELVHMENLASRGQQHPSNPVTLHLSHEARLETLRHYTRETMIKFQFTLDKPPSKIAIELDVVCGYFNPILDTLHFTGNFNWTFVFGWLIDEAATRPPIPSPTQVSRQLLPTIGIWPRHINLGLLRPNHSLYFAMRFFLAGRQYLETMDFWAAEYRDMTLYEMELDDTQMDCPMRVARYRICRTSGCRSLALTTAELVRWSSGIPSEIPWQMETMQMDYWETDCLPASRVTEGAKPETIRTGLDASIFTMIDTPSGEVEFDATTYVTRWSPEIRDILQREGALIFDGNREKSDFDTNVTCEREWSVLRVVDENLWSRRVMQLASNYFQLLHEPEPGQTGVDQFHHVFEREIIGKEIGLTSDTSSDVLPMVEYILARQELDNVENMYLENLLPPHLKMMELCHGVCRSDYQMNAAASPHLSGSVLMESWEYSSKKAFTPEVEYPKIADEEYPILFSFNAL